MTRRSKIIILIVLLILALLFLFWLLWSLFRPATSIKPVETGTRPLPPTEEQLPTPEPEQPSVEQQQHTQSASVQSLSKTFTERYGSFSSESDFANLRDVEVLMTASFAAQTQAYIDTAVAPEDYYSVTTRVVSIAVDAMDETAGMATVSIATQREEAKDEPQNISVRYQTLKLELKMEDGEWKVDSATWL